MTATSRSSTSWLGTLAQPSVFDTKFSTVNLGSTSRNRSRPGLFEEDLPSRSSGSRSRIDAELQDLQGLGEHEGGWSVTVAEGPKARSRGRKPDPVLTVYVSTATSSLTLSRKLSEIVELEARLQAQFPGRLPARTLTSLSTSTPKKRNNVLASLTRTLSPRRNNTASYTSFGSAGKETRGASVDVKDLGSVLTKASFDPSIREHAAWKSFFVVRKDDMESHRVERRIKRARSDATMHLATVEVPPPLPTHLLPINSSIRHPQEASAGTVASTTTEEVVASTGTELFDLGQIPSATIKLDTPATPQPAEVDVDEKIEEEEEASRGASVIMEDAPSLDEIELVKPVQEPQADDSTVQPSKYLSDSPRSVVSRSDSFVDDRPSTPPCFAAPSEPDSPVSTRQLSKPKRTSLQPPSADVGTRRTLSRSMSDLGSSVGSLKKPEAVNIDSFEVLRVLGKGCAGKVLLVKEKKAGTVLALKAITKRHVLAHRELLHTRTEQTVLKMFARDKSNPFIVKLHYSWADEDTLFLALDFHPGGDLATQLARWGRLGRDRARFYMAEICEGVEGLHRGGIIYRDLKPENILISFDGHIVLTDFGLSKDFGHSKVEPPTATLGDGLPRPHWLDNPSRSASTPAGSSWGFGHRETTTSFCGTAEYLAPEVLLGEPYSYEVDTWSAGTMLYEMLCGVTPFFADDHATMYRRVLHDDILFDDPRVFDDDTKSLLRGMLQRDPLLRMTDARIKKHKYFAAISWEHIYHKRYVPPFVPTINPDDPTDVSQFDDVFLSMPAQIKGGDDEPGAGREPPEGEPQAAFDENGRDVFSGYDWMGRDSASIHRSETDEEADATRLAVEDEENAIEDTLRTTTEVVPVDSPLSESLPLDDKTPPPASPVQHDPQTPQATTQNGFFTSTPPPALPHAHSSVPSSSETSSSKPPSTLTVPSSVDLSHSPSHPAAAPESPTLTRARLASSRSNLAPLPEERPVSSTSGEVLLEEAEEHSDSEWDVVETGGDVQSARNGGRGATFFSRGIKDKYRLVLAPLGSPRPGLSRTRSSRPPSSSSINSAVSSISPSGSASLHPEPSLSARAAIRRLASVRSSTSAGATFSNRTLFLGSKPSQRSLGERPSSSDGRGEGSRSVPPSPKVDSKLFKRGMTTSASTGAIPDAEATPRKAGQAFKKFAKSAFLPSPASNRA